MNTTGTGASFRQLSARTQLITLAFVYCGVLITTLLDPTNPSRTGWVLGAGVIVLIIVLAILHAYIALRTPTEPDDERDIHLELRASRFSQLVLGTGVVLAIGILITQQIWSGFGEASPFLTSPLLASQILLFCLVSAEMLRLTLQLQGYRRGY
jgi:hypothetical protein